MKKQSQNVLAQIGVKSYLKGDYEEIHALRQRKNKANSQAFGRKSETTTFYRVLFEKTKPIYSFSVQRAVFCEKEFEKTKPILEGVNECNYILDKG